MAPKTVTYYHCSECEYSQPKKFYVCPTCGHEGGSHPVDHTPGKKKSSPHTEGARETSDSFVSMDKVMSVRGERGERASKRLSTGIGEVDRVLGGGFVVGAPVMLYGSWGNGKSTLVTQIIRNLISQGLKVAVISGEESDEAWLDRLLRLGAEEKTFSHLMITQNTMVDETLPALTKLAPDLVIIDSLQTMQTGSFDGIPGDAGQIKRSMHMICEFARAQGITPIVIGQVTKGGDAAGPNLVMHSPDVNLVLEGDDRYGLRILRVPKNRHGENDEIGVFEMTGDGLIEVPDPSAMFIADRAKPVMGSVVCPVIEGKRPMLVEVQALVSPTNSEKPLRVVDGGYDRKRFDLMMMALTKHCGLRIGSFDIGLSISDGVKVTDTALDLAVCLAIASSYLNVSPDKPLAACGQVSLLGEIRPVVLLANRIKEAKRLNFGHMITPENSKTLKEAIVEACGTLKRMKGGEDGR